MVRCLHQACELLVGTMLDEETTLGDLLKNRSSCKKNLSTSLSENLSVKANYYYKTMSISIETLPNFVSPLPMPSFPNANDQLYNELYQSSFLSSSSFLGSKLS